jgi:rhamnopyranosyl-N-acetylglucosaminyl-diphospho-decaprenol beta-1,3/1,4-galactofuranosyltransferase
MSSGVAVGLVTYNRKKDLVFGLEKLAKSTVLPEVIYVIDNASTDGTFELLVNEGYQFSNISNPYLSYGVASIYESSLSSGIKLIYAIATKNMGGAGGFWLAQQLIMTGGHKWMWLMDDDGHPEARCLEVMLEFADKSGIQVLNPLVIEIGTHDKLAFGLPGNVDHVDSAIASAKDGLIAGAANPFNGTLIKDNVVKSVGFIKKEMFIWGDEVEYTKRLTKLGVKYATVVDAQFYHPASKSTIERVWKLFSVVVKPKKLEMNYYRNAAYLQRIYSVESSFVYLVKYTGYFLSRMELGRLITFYRYFFDGWFNNYKLPPLR